MSKYIKELKFSDKSSYPAQDYLVDTRAIKDADDTTKTLRQTITGLHGDVTRIDADTTSIHTDIDSINDNITSLGDNKANKSSTVVAGTYSLITVNSEGIATSGSNPTAIADLGITDVYTKTETDTKIAEAVSTVYKFKGTCTYAELIAKTDQKVGDVWNVTDSHGTTPAGTNYVWDGSNWDPLAGQVDLSIYYKKTEVDGLLNNKADKSTTVSAGEYTKVSVNAQGIVTGGSTPSTLAGYNITDAYTDTEVDAVVAEAITDSIKYRGSCKYAELPTATAKKGDVWTVTDAHGEMPAGTNYIFDGTAWNPMSGATDLTNYYKKSEVDSLIDTRVPTSGGTYSALSVGYATNSSTVNGLTVQTAVPTNAKFTDTTYSVATTTSNGLLSASDKSKLDGIDAGANKYTHPSDLGSTKSLGFYKIAANAAGHVTSVREVAKSDITALGIPAQDTTYSAGTGIGLSGTTFSNSGVRSIATGSSNGTISVNTNGTTKDVSVKGLGSAAYTASTAYAAASHGNHVPTTETASNSRFLRNDNTWQTVTPGNIGAATSGHTHTGIASLGDVVTFDKSLKLTTDWVDTGIAGTNLETGVYVISVYSNNYGVGGGNYYETGSGIMSWYAGTTNSSNADEIFLHRSGHADGDQHVYLRTLRVASSGYLKLQASCSVNTTGNSTYTFKFKKLM